MLCGGESAMKTDDGSSRGQSELRNQGELEAVSPEAVVDFRRDGVAIVRRVLSPEWLAVVEAGIARNLANPGPHATVHFDDRPDLAIYDDRCNYENISEYQRL